MPLGYLALAVLLGTSVVSVLKSCSPMDCPRDLARYGGTRAYHGLLQGSDLPGRCFTAGQASAGYAWLALFFLFTAFKPSGRRHGLVVGIGLGLLFGLARQITGA